MVETEKFGYYHATNEDGYISWYDFTCEIFKQAGYINNIIPVTTEEYGMSKVARPFNSQLDRSIEMGQIKVEKNINGIEGLCLIEPAVHGDSRGYCMETYSQRDMKEAGINITFVQDNQSMSTKDVLKGPHFQKNFPQTKLVRVISGSVFDMAVDLRSGSEIYGKWYDIELTAENRKQFLIPRGFAHGFLMLLDTADLYQANDEGCLAWNDPESGINWASLGVVGTYNGSVSAEGYTIKDGASLNLNDKHQKWVGIKDTFKF